MSITNQEIRDSIAQNDVTMGRSYLEVDVMEWFSDNEVPFAYEAFTIPSVVGPNRDEWDTMVNAIQSVGRRDFDEYDELTEGTRWEDMRPAEILAMWEDIYDKHLLQQERVTVEVRRSLSEYNKRMILPDFAIYPDVGFKTAPEGFDWSSWSYIVEVSGLWGVGLPGEATEGDWWDWYRVAAVAYKELAYKLLGLWEDVYWVVPFEPYIPGVTDGIPTAIRDDPHYVIANITRSDLGIDELADALGITARPVDAGLSPSIEPTEYERPRQGLGDGVVGIGYEFDGLNLDNIQSNENVVVPMEDMIVFHGELGEVYITPDSVHVNDSMYRNVNILILREYVLDSLSELSEDGIVNGLGRVE